MAARIPLQVLMGVLGAQAEAAAPGALTDLAATANLDGTITVSWTLPEGATGALVRYNVDQAAAPSEQWLGIDLGLVVGTSVVLSGCEYGATYRFSAWSYGAGGYASAADTASAVGPLNPLAYSSALKLWLDARREDAYADSGQITTPQDFAAGGFGLTQATAANKPLWRNAANGINGMPAFQFQINVDAPKCWIAANTGVTLDTQGAAAGFSVAAIATTVSDLGEKALISHWANSGSGFRRWRLFQGAAANVFTLGLSTDGNNQTGALTYTGLSGTGPYSMIATYLQGTGAYTFKNGDGLDDTDLTVGTALAAPSATACLRVGNGRGTVSDPYDGLATLLLGYSTPLSRTAAELLDAALAALAGS